MTKWRTLVSSIKYQISYYKALASDPRTPRLSKYLIGIALSYMVSPIDIIPDFIPIIGYLDDLIIVPTLIYIAMVFIPKIVKIEVKQNIYASKQIIFGN